MRKVVSPDQLDYRRPYEQEREYMLEAARSVGEDLSLNFTPGERFYDAWRGHPSDDASRIMGLIGADEFTGLFAASLRRAKAWIQEIIRDHLKDLTTVLDPIDEVSSGAAPDLIGWSRGELGILRPNGHMSDDLATVCPIADHWGDDDDLIVEESLRVLTLASKIRRLEAVDPWDYVTQDMTRINELCWERLWVGRKVLLTVNYAVYKDGDHEGYVHPDVPITFAADRPVVPWETERRSIIAKCRVVQDGETTYLLLTKSRPKDLEATILKEEELDPQADEPRCRAALDRRGIMHVLVAIGVRGQWRAATPDDIDTFGELTRHRLWKKPLVLVDRKQWKNPESNPAYRRVKMLGRYHRKSNRAEDIEVWPSVEHQIIAIETLLSSLGAKTTLNHDIYRATRIRRVLVPKLFKSNFERLGGMSTD